MPISFLFFFVVVLFMVDATLQCLNGIYEVEDGNGGQRDNHLKMMNIKTYLIKRTEPLRSRRSIRQPFVVDNEKTPKFVEAKSATSTPSNHQDHSMSLAHNGHQLIKRISRSIIHDHDDEQTTDWTPEIPFQNVGHHTILHARLGAHSCVMLGFFFLVARYNKTWSFGAWTRLSIILQITLILQPAILNL